MKNWIEFFRNKELSEIDIDSLEKIHNLLSNFYSQANVPPRELFEALNNNFPDYLKVIKALEISNIIKYSPSCQNCNTILDFPKTTKIIIDCPHCNEEIDILELNDSITLLDSGKDISILLDASYELNALIISKQALQKKKLYYLLCDIEGSQKLQEADRPYYNSLIKKLWTNYWPNALLECRKVYIPLMAKGDACIIAFLDFNDSFSVLQKISQSLVGEKFKLSAYLDEIDYTQDDFTGFVRSLDNKWDFNSLSATLFHRKANELKPNIWNSSDDYRIKVCLLDNLTKKKDIIPELKDLNLITEEYSFKTKHNEIMTGSISGYLS
ncbi:hypothetical protein EHQ23_02445 [Leptospira bourretii]|uniref:Adenylate/guanylate cyclase domain-containing protein n=1 Tax=Leptospira bourretii TaxID=2484962 RepID=A0A4R9INN0_9LEPT|nr:hypothetical protein [Leptospira bourretii]TGK89996.1 hypothetical protein EHQ23_02445 [Leptospira bourretii]TGK92219.1 hypothetical protein EHQ26_09590 [Leptospira bourretii]